MLRALSSRVQGVQRTRTSTVQMDKLPETQALAKQPQRSTKLRNNERHTTGLIMATRLQSYMLWVHGWALKIITLDRSLMGTMAPTDRTGCSVHLPFCTPVGNS